MYVWLQKSSHFFFTNYPHGSQWNRFSHFSNFKMIIFSLLTSKPIWLCSNSVGVQKQSSCLPAPPKSTTSDSSSKGNIFVLGKNQQRYFVLERFPHSMKIYRRRLMRLRAWVGNPGWCVKSTNHPLRVNSGTICLIKRVNPDESAFKFVLIT